MALPRAVLTAALLGSVAVPFALPAQTAAPAATANRTLGTVKSVSGNTLTLATDAGATVTVTLSDAVRVQQASSDLKTVQPSSVDAIAAGDRVSVSGAPSDAGTLTATRVLLMKSAAIAQRNQSTQADWNRRGSGGIVTSVDAATGTIDISSGTRKVAVETKNSTIYRRYAPGSVKFEEAKPGTQADVHPGDQLRVRGDRSADGLTVTAEEIVSGSFKNLSGTVVSINAGANTLVIKDLATKKNEVVTIGSESDLRALPPEAAARFAAARTRPGAGAAARTAAAGPPAGAPPAATGASAALPPDGSAGRRPGGYGAGPGANPGGGPGMGGPGGRASGADLSQMIPRLPKSSLADFKTGEALMIVASGNSGGPYTAITVLSGVEALLTGPAGSEITLPPWSSGAAGGGEGGGATE